MLVRVGHVYMISWRCQDGKSELSQQTSVALPTGKAGVDTRRKNNGGADSDSHADGDNDCDSQVISWLVLMNSRSTVLPLLKIMLMLMLMMIMMILMMVYQSRDH